MKSKLIIGVIAVGFLSAGAKAGITTAVYDFENLSATTGGGLTSLSATNNGLTVTIDRVGQPFDIVNLSSYSGTSAFGSRSLAPTPPGSNFFNVNFSSPVSSFSVDMGDFGANASDSLALTAFAGANGTGKNLGTSSASLPLINNTTLAYKTLTFNGTGIGSVEFTGGTTANPNSVYVDNLKASFNASGSGSGTGGGSGGGSGASVPLPMAAYAMPFGAAVAWLAARKMRGVAVV